MGYFNEACASRQWRWGREQQQQRQVWLSITASSDTVHFNETWYFSYIIKVITSNYSLGHQTLHTPWTDCWSDQILRVVNWAQTCGKTLWLVLAWPPSFQNALHTPQLKRLTATELYVTFPNQRQHKGTGQTLRDILLRHINNIWQLLFDCSVLTCFNAALMMLLMTQQSHYR